jgi:hypothetical protein
LFLLAVSSLLLLRDILADIAIVVTPPNSLEVEQAIEILRSYPCPIAVKSGGHAPSAGMSNVEGGVTIDLKLLNQVEYLGPQDWDGTPSGKGQDSWEGHVTRVGPGNRWSRVYEVLEKHNVSVVGGRASTVGVGGFVLGGMLAIHDADGSVQLYDRWEIFRMPLTNMNRWYLIPIPQKWLVCRYCPELRSCLAEWNPCQRQLSIESSVVQSSSWRRK